MAEFRVLNSERIAQKIRDCGLVTGSQLFTALPNTNLTDVLHRLVESDVCHISMASIFIDEMYQTVFFPTDTYKMSLDNRHLENNTGDRIMLSGRDFIVMNGQPQQQKAVDAGPRAPCLCGCGAVPKGKKAKFMPGHDARYHAAQKRKVLEEVANKGMKGVEKMQREANKARSAYIDAKQKKKEGK